MIRVALSYVFVLGLITLCCSCNGGKKSKGASLPDEIQLKYARGFSIKKDSIYTWIEVKHPFQNAEEGFVYLLVPRGASIPSHDKSVRVISIPVQSIACTSTTHIPLLDYLNETESLRGFTTLDYISSPRARKRIDEGKVQELGVDKGINIEALIAIKPDLLMGYSMTSEYGQFRKIEELGVPVVINAEYLETHPLGRAEWIKFMAEFFDKSGMADSVFLEIEKRYLEVRDIASGDPLKPSVLTGIMYGDAWFVPGGKNYAAEILDDASLQYPWTDDPSHGFLELGFESVLSKAHDCNYWIGVGPFKSLAEMQASDHRYSMFDAFKNKNVFAYDARQGAKGGNEYLELGYLRPDIILADLVKITHPELLPDHKLYFHRRLN